MKKTIFFIIFPLVLMGYWFLETTPGKPDQILLAEQNEENIYQTLAVEVPDFSIHSLSLISSGSDNLVAEINEEWIFRFPRLEKFIPLIEREQKLLNKLESKTSFQIPRYEYIGRETAFVGYRKIPGNDLTKEAYLQLDEEARENLAKSLASFLLSLHHVMSREEAIAFGYEHYRLPIESIDPSKMNITSDGIKRMIKEALKVYQANPDQTTVLLHNDLHGGNFAFNSSSETITGIFDFTDAILGDATVDLAKLFYIHEDFALRTARIYAQMNGLGDLSLKTASEFILRRTATLLEAQKSQDSARKAKSIKILEDFIPIWDKLKASNN